MYLFTAYWFNGKKKTHQEFDFFILSYKKGKFLVSQILQGWNNIFF